MSKRQDNERTSEHGEAVVDPCASNLVLVLQEKTVLIYMGLTLMNEGLFPRHPCGWAP